MTQTITEKEFPAYIKTLSKERWNTLFALLPEVNNRKEFGHLNKMEETEDGVYVFPTYNHAEVVVMFLEIVYDLGLIINFDWQSWEQGSKILSDPSSNFKEMDITTLCKLLTTIVRADRFNDGFLIVNFNDGTMGKILEALKLKTR